MPKYMAFHGQLRKLLNRELISLLFALCCSESINMLDRLMSIAIGALVMVFWLLSQHPYFN